MARRLAQEPVQEAGGTGMNEDKLEKLIATAKYALKMLRQGRKWSRMPANSPKEANKRLAETNDAFREFERQKHELHCLGVELGFACPEEWRYGNKKVHMGDAPFQHRELNEFRRYPEGHEEGEK